MSAVAAALLAASLMWPFGSDPAKNPPPRQDTLGTLQNRSADLPPEPPAGDEASQRASRSYEQYLQRPQTDPKLAAEAMRRLADLDLENADVADSGDEKKRLALYRQSAARYRELLQRYPDPARDEQVLYQLARAEEGSGNPQQALAALGEHARRYPQSALISEVQFRRGELLFGQNRYADAEAAFAAVVALGPDAKGPASYYEPALYKQGWSRFKQDEFQGSLDIFFKLLGLRLGTVAPSAIETHLAALPRPEHELIEDSLRAMALACLDLGSPGTSVPEQLARHGEPAYGYLLYSDLAAVYLKQQRYSDAAATLMSLGLTHPENPHASAFQIQAIAALETGGFATQALALREDYVNRFADKPVPAGRSPDEQVAAANYLRESIWMVAQQHHALEQNANATPAERARDSAAAADFYRRYARSFPKDALTPQAQFRLGDVLYDAGDLPGAIGAYEAAAYDYPAFDQRADAGYAAIQAYEKHENTLSGADRDTWHRKRLTADLRFSNSFSERKEAAQVQSNTAAGLFEAGDTAQGLAVAESVVKDPHANPEALRVAWHVIGLANFDNKNYANSEAAYLELQKLAPPNAPVDRETSDRLAAAIYKQGEQARDAGNFEQAAEHFSRVAIEAPGARIRVTADYDAALARLKAGDAAQAIPMLVSFRDQHADNPLVADITRTLATTYEKNGQPREAAAELQRIADTLGTDPELQRAALWHSAELLQTVDAPAAERALRQYTQRFPRPFDQAIEAYGKLIEQAAARGNRAAQAEWSARLVEFEAAGGEQRTQRSRTLAAHAAMLPARVARENFRSVELVRPLRTNMLIKRQLLEEALADYVAATGYGVADVVTESTYETAELYHNMAEAMKQSARPRGLDAAALEQYNVLLDEEIFPLEDKAISIHEANARRAKTGLYDTWVQKSYAELAGLSPGRYGKSDFPEASVAAGGADTAALSSDATRAFDAAVADMSAGNDAAAEAGFKSLLDSHPELAGAAVNLALVYRHENLAADEEATLRHAAEQWPRFAPAQHQLGVWLRRHGQFVEADEAQARAIGEDPGYAAAHYDRGVLNDLYLQRPQQALSEYETYQKLLAAPDPQVNKWIADLRRRASAPVASGFPATGGQP